MVSLDTVKKVSIINDKDIIESLNGSENESNVFSTPKYSKHYVTLYLGYRYINSSNKQLM